MQLQQALHSAEESLRRRIAATEVSRRAEVWSANLQAAEQRADLFRAHLATGAESLGTGELGAAMAAFQAALALTATESFDTKDASTLGEAYSQPLTRAPQTAGWLAALKQQAREHLVAGAESLETGDIEAAMGAFRAALAIAVYTESFQHTQDEPLSTEVQRALADARRALAAAAAQTHWS